MKLTKDAANYGAATEAGVNCGTCAYMLPTGQCQKVTGLVDRAHVCDLYEKISK